MARPPERVRLPRVLLAAEKTLLRVGPEAHLASSLARPARLAGEPPALSRQQAEAVLRRAPVAAQRLKVQAKLPAPMAQSWPVPISRPAGAARW